MRRIAVLVALTMCACTHNNNPKPKEPALEKGIVVLEGGGKTLRVEVELARTPAQREKGLMFRKKLNPYQGMLFLFDTQEVQSFWMKNTYIPLDMIFIDEAMTVVGVVENAAPLTLTSRRVEAPSRYVLEVRGGFAATHGIGPGTRVKLERDGQ